MVFRLIALAALLLLAWYIYRRLAPRIAADPRLRVILSGVGLRMLQIFLLRRALPLLWRAIRTLRFFR